MLAAVMSEVMSLRVTIESRSANKSRASDADDVLCCLKVPNKLLHNWYLTRQKKSSTSIVTQLNANLDAIIIVKDTMEKRLRNKGALLAMKLNRATKRSKLSLLERASMLDLRKDEVENINSLK